MTQSPTTYTEKACFTNTLITSWSQRLGYGIVFVIIVFGVQIPLLCGFLFKLYYIRGEIGSFATPVNIFFITLLAAVPFVAALYIAAARQIPERAIILGLLIFIFLSRLLLVVSVDQHPISDFMRMWTYVSNIVSTDNFTSPVSRPEMRAIPYLLPFTYIFQGSPFGYQFGNCIAITLIAFLVYYLTTLLFNQRAGLVALIIFAFAPEPLFLAEIPNHNAPGALFLMASLAAVIIILKSITVDPPPLKKLIILSLLLSVGIGLTDLQRNVGVFIFLSLLLLTIIKINQINRKAIKLTTIYLLACLLVIPYISSYIMEYAVHKTTHADEFREMMRKHKLEVIASHANSQSLGSFSVMADLLPYMNLFSLEELREFARHKSLSHLFYDFSARPKTYLKKAMILYHLGRQYDEYYGDLKNDDYKSTTLYRYFTIYNWIFALIFILVALVTIVFLALMKLSVDVLFPILFLGTLSLSLLLMGEVQSSYVFSAWMILPIYIGVAAVSVKTGGYRFQHLKSNAIAFFIAAGGIIIAISAALFILFNTYTLVNGRMFTMEDWRIQGDVERAIGPFNILLKKGPVGGPDAIISGEVNMAGDSARDLLFFSKGYSENNSACRYTLEVKANQFSWKKDLIYENGDPFFWKLDGILPDQGKLRIEIHLTDPPPRMIRR